ncbi:MAG: SET domain-containing protein-lysine N-methyltransferase [Chitinophagaceae bacterium]|nr:SET domain-containing protein-lysine N-methyltransferase [Chitinophagaceae bacterium]
MFNPFKQKEILQPDGIEIRQSLIDDRGVFTTRIFKPGAVIETAPVILLDRQERELLQTTFLFNYYFLLANETTPVALGLGYSSLYNHSYNANAVYTISLNNRSLIVNANKMIHPGDEITFNYNGKADDDTPVYFQPGITE